MGLIKTAAEILSGRRMPPGWVPPVRPKVGRPPLNRRCDLPDCDRKHHGGGLCQKHFDVKSKWGNPLHVYVRGKQGRCVCPDHPWGAYRGSHKNS